MTVAVKPGVLESVIKQKNIRLEQVFHLTACLVAVRAYYDRGETIPEKHLRLVAGEFDRRRDAGSEHGGWFGAPRHGDARGHRRG